MNAAATNYLTRDEAIARIRIALKQRSGKAWSVKGGRGTAYGWIDISVPTARKSCSMDHVWDASGITCRDCGRHYLDVRGTALEGCEAHVCTDTCYIAYVSPADRAELAALLGVERVHCQGVSISPDARSYYVMSAEGR